MRHPGYEVNLDHIGYGGSAVSGLLSVGNMISREGKNGKARTHVLKPSCVRGMGAYERYDILVLFKAGCYNK